MKNMNEFVITIDVDWAPDIAIDIVANILRRYEIKSTWFVTHYSQAIDSLRSYADLFELGIHPNFLPGSSHGTSAKEVITTLMQIVPEAQSIRSHCVFQSGPLLSTIVLETPIKVDSTLFLPEMPNIRPIAHLTPHGTLTRLPFFWADDYELLKKQPIWNLDRYLTIPGIKVLMFHPIHILLNSESISAYNDYKLNAEEYNETSLDQAIDRLTKSDKGIASLFMQAIKHVSKTRSEMKTIKDYTI